MCLTLHYIQFEIMWSPCGFITEVKLLGGRKLDRHQQPYIDCKFHCIWSMEVSDGSRCTTETTVTSKSLGCLFRINIENENSNINFCQGSTLAICNRLHLEGHMHAQTKLVNCTQLCKRFA